MAERGKEAGPAAADGTTTQWETYASSAIGADHRRDHSPNQDAVALKRFGPPGPDSLAVLAVADGHGDARHFRSDRGSKLAVTAAVAAAGSWAASISAGAVPSRAAAGQLVSDLVARWRDAVHADLAEYPVGSGQAGAIREGDPPEIPYGTTLLLIAARADVAVLAQIGDGDIFLVGHDGRLITPVPGDRRLDGTYTTSLCQPDAVSAFRMALVSLARTPVYAIFAATDGYGNAQAEPDWKARWAADLVGLGRAYGAGWIGEQLKDWVAACASSDGSGDDTTAALALNPTATAARSAPARLLPPAAGPTLAAGPTPAARPTLAARPDRRHADPAPDDLTMVRRRHRAGNRRRRLRAPHRAGTRADSPDNLADAHPHGEPHADAHPEPDSESDPEPDARAHAHANLDPNPDSTAERNTDRQAEDHNPGGQSFRRAADQQSRKEVTPP